jgi:hypothetical protein
MPVEKLHGEASEHLDPDPLVETTFVAASRLTANETANSTNKNMTTSFFIHFPALALAMLAWPKAVTILH